MSKRNRRQFLEDSMLATAAAVAVGSADEILAADDSASSSPNEKLGVAVVGVRGRGGSHIGAFAGRARGRDFCPFRLTPSHAWARDQGAVFVETGMWLRAQWFPRPGETHWRESVDREVVRLVVLGSAEEGGVDELGTSCCPWIQATDESVVAADIANLGDLHRFGFDSGRADSLGDPFGDPGC